MSNVGIFIAGVAITIPAALGILGLLLAAVSDGRENSKAQLSLDASAPGSEAT